MLSDNPGASAPRENRTGKRIASALVLLLAILLWQGDRIWDHLAGTPRSDELLFCASGQGDLAGIERALEQGADINARGMGQLTPIMVACDAGGNASAVQRLLDRGADPNLQALTGITALYNAVNADNAEVAKVLLHAGVDPNHELRGETMLDIAVRLDREATVKVLLAHGARSARATSLASNSLSTSM